MKIRQRHVRAILRMISQPFGVRADLADEDESGMEQWSERVAPLLPGIAEHDREAARGSGSPPGTRVVVEFQGEAERRGPLLLVWKLRISRNRTDSNVVWGWSRSESRSGFMPLTSAQKTRPTRCPGSSASAAGGGEDRAKWRPARRTGRLRVAHRVAEEARRHRAPRGAPAFLLDRALRRGAPRHGARVGAQPLPHPQDRSFLVRPHAPRAQAGTSNWWPPTRPQASSATFCMAAGRPTRSS